MSGDDKSKLYKTLNEATALLNQSVTTGMCSVYLTVDRVKYNELLKAITEAKRMLIRPTDNFGDS